MGNKTQWIADTMAFTISLIGALAVGIKYGFGWQEYLMMSSVMFSIYIKR